MKKDWEIKKLGDVCDIINGKNQKAVEDKNGPYPIYGSGGIMGYASEYLCRENTTIIGRKGSINNPLYVEEKFWNVDTAFGFQSKENYIPKLLFYFCKSFDFSTHNKGTTIPSLVKSDLLEIAIPVPPLEEQKRIVKILDEKFAQLETIKANAQTNLQNAKDLFQSQLAKAFSNTTWEKKRLETISKIKSGFAFKGSAFKTTGEYQVLRLGNVKQNYLRIDEKAVFVSGISTSDLLKAKANIGDLIVTQTGTKGKRDYGFVAIVDRDNLLLNQRLAAITTAECLYNRYLLYYSYTESFKDQFFANEGGTVGQGNIGLTDIKEIEVPLPPLPEQKRIVKELDTLSEKVRQLQEIYTKQIANCDELKQSLLQKAFEGEL